MSKIGDLNDTCGCRIVFNELISSLTHLFGTVASGMFRSATALRNSLQPSGLRLASTICDAVTPLPKSNMWEPRITEPLEINLPDSFH